MDEVDGRSGDTQFKRLISVNFGGREKSSESHSTCRKSRGLQKIRRTVHGRNEVAISCGFSGNIGGGGLGVVVYGGSDPEKKWH